MMVKDKIGNRWKPLINSTLFSVFFLFSANCKSAPESQYSQGVHHKDPQGFKQKNDSLLRSIDKYKKNQLDSAYYFAGLLVKNAEKSKDTLLLINAYKVKLKMSAVDRHYVPFSDCASKILKLSEAINDPRGICYGYNMLGVANQGLLNYEKAQKYFHTSLTLSEELKDTVLIMSALNNTANFYQTTGNKDRAKRYYQESLEISELKGDSSLIAFAKVSLAIILNEKRENELALKYLNNAFDFYQLKGDLFTQTKVLGIIADVYMDMGDHELADNYLSQCLSISKSINSVHLIATASINKAENWLLQNQFDSCLTYLNLANDYYFSVQKKDIPGLKHYTRISYEYYKKTDDHTSAIEFYERFVYYRDSLNGAKIQGQLIQEQINFDLTRQKNADSLRFITQRKSDLIQNNLEKDKFKIRYIILIIGSLIILISVVFYFLYYIKRYRKKYAALLDQIKLLKSNYNFGRNKKSVEFNQLLIEERIDFNLNASDWAILKELHDKPHLTIKGVAEQVNLSYEGVRSSLKKMYVLFDVDKSSTSKKSSLIIRVLEIAQDT